MVCRIKNRHTFKSLPILNSAYFTECRFVIRHITQTDTETETEANFTHLKIWTATHTFSLLMLTQLTMAVNGLLLRQCVSKAIFKLTAYTSEFKFLLKQTIKYYILIFWVIKLYFSVILTVLAHFWQSCHFNSPQVQQFLRYFWLTYTAVIYSLLWI